MFEVRDSVQIDRPVEEVFDYFSDLSNEEEWNPQAKSVTKTTDGPVGVGTVFDANYKRSGKMKMTMSTYNRPGSYAMTGTAMGASWEYEATMTPDGAGTALTSTMKMTPKGPAVLMAPLMKSMISKQMHRSHAALKDAMEHRKASSQS